MQAAASARIRARIALVQPSVDAVTARFWSHPRIAALYPRVLAVYHPIMGAAVELMDTAATLAAARDDALAEPLSRYLHHHAGEERGHDQWVLSDLVALGFPPSVVDGPPPAFAASFLDQQRRWIDEVHPVAFLGYLAAIEGRPPRLDEVDAIQARTGFPAEAFTNYRKHAHADPRHSADLDAALDALPLDEAHVALIGASAMDTVRRVRELFAGLLAEADATAEAA
jgi:hypothetical protein